MDDKKPTRRAMRLPNGFIILLTGLPPFPTIPISTSPSFHSPERGMQDLKRAIRLQLTLLPFGMQV